MTYGPEMSMNARGDEASEESLYAPERPVPVSYRLLHAASASGGGAMTFEEILDQAITMLQRRRRVAYRTLQVQFHLDDNALEALKDELLYAQQVAQDEDGRVLIWTGGTDVSPTTLPRAPQPALPGQPLAS